MTRREAMEYNNELRNELEQAARGYGLEESVGGHIVDHYITILPENARKGMIFLKEEYVSYKAGNIKVDFKKALVAGLELMVSVSRPESVFNYIQLIILSLFFIEKSVKREISDIEAHVVYLLHKKDAYNIEINEEKLICDVQEWYMQHEEKVIEHREIVDAINALHDIKAIDFKEGNIILKEKVWGTLER